jgi:hypothetical protein
MKNTESHDNERQPTNVGDLRWIRQPFSLGWLWPVVAGILIGNSVKPFSLLNGPGNPVSGAALGGLLGVAVAVLLRIKATRRRINLPSLQSDSTVRLTSRTDELSPTAIRTFPTDSGLTPRSSSVDCPGGKIFADGRSQG